MLSFDPSKVLEDLLVKLFMGIPTLLEQLAPEGFDKSPYFLIYNRPLEKEYVLDLHAEMFHFFWNKDKIGQTPDPKLKSLEEYEKLHGSRHVDATADMAKILCLALDAIKTSGFFAITKNNEPFGFECLMEYPDILNNAGKRAGFIKNAHKRYFGYSPCLNPIPKDLEAPLFNHIFSALKEMDIIWCYYNAMLAYYVRLANGNGHLEKTWFDQFTKARKEVPNEVVAYFDINSTWPQGYPPQLADYR